MRFSATPIPGLVVIEEEPSADHRGSFARVWCGKEFSEAGLADSFSQVSISRNRLSGTLRGIHFQTPPHAEAKLVKVTEGAIWDLALDMRPGSGTYLKWFGLTLSSENGRSLFIPEGFGHGFLTLTDNAAVMYFITTPFAPGAASGVRWNDPAFAIVWPAAPVIMAEKDRAWPDFKPF